MIGEWQPMSTAPRDGTKVILGHAGHRDAFYDRDRKPRVWIDFYRGSSWYNTAPSGQPDGWMPAPPPPTADR